MNKKILTIALAGVIIIGGLVVVRLTTTTPKSVTPASGSQSEYVIPGMYSNQITNSSTIPGLVIKQAITENNVDSTGKVVSDHLQITLANTTSAIIHGLQVYYTITDTKTGQREAYNTPLSNLTIGAKSMAEVNLDGTTGDGHYPVNKSGLLYSGKDEMRVEVEVSAIGFAPQHATTTKSAGGADRVD